MKVLVLICLLWICTSSASSSGDSFYSGFTVYRTHPRTGAHVSFLQQLQEQNNIFDFWTEVRFNRTVDIMSPPAWRKALEANLTKMDIEHGVMIPDVQKLIEMEKVNSVSRHESADHDMTWDDYHPLEHMYSYLDYLEQQYEYVSTEVIGQSTEKRDMRVVSVCKGGCGRKPAVWIDGGIHAREWISPATVTWMLKELVENDKSHSDLTEKADWYIVPSMNPDGYAYSREDDSHRLWRKTRSDHGSQLRCKGVDPNRNWSWHFNEGGASNDKCSNMYHGPEAFSEPENVNARDFLKARKGKFVFFNTIHSYGQLILLPWGYTKNLPDDYEQMYQLAMKGSDAIAATHGKQYDVGCVPCVLKDRGGNPLIASGGSLDWAKGDQSIPFTIGMELRDTNGFILPPEQIIPTAEEAWAFHVTVVREILKKL